MVLHIIRKKLIYELHTNNKYVVSIQKMDDNPLEILVQENPVCSICLEDIEEDDIYAIIEGSPEGNIRYHANCVQQWFNHKDNIKNQGIISRNPVNSYTIYQYEEQIAYINLNEQQTSNTTTNITVIPD